MKILKRMTGGMGGTIQRIWPLVLVALFAELGYATIGVGVIPNYLNEPPPQGLGASASVVGLIIAMYLVTETFAKAPMGLSGDRLGRKWFMAGGLLVSALMAFLMRYATTPAMFFPLRALDGIGAAAIWPCLFASVAALTSAEERVGAMSAFNMMYMIGLALALPTYSWAFHLTGHHRTIFTLVSFVFLIGLVICLVAVPNTSGEEHSEGSFIEAGGAIGETQHVGLKELLTLSARSTTLRAMLIASLLQATGVNLLNGVVVIYGRQQLGIDAGNIGKIFILPGIAVVLLAIPVGRLGGSWGRVKSVKAGIITSIIAMFLIPVAGNLWTLSAIVVPFIIGFLLATPAWLALITEMAPPGRQGLVVGAVATAQGIGAMVAPALGGAIYDVRPTLPFYAAGILLTASLYFVFTQFHEDMKVELPDAEARG